ncbi:MAG: LysR family transcriptional regulator [Gordonia sp. (in: high G+C Gram-positive bacteria)]|uniref:LysR family transcriptional regulator n=1 Tax=Gordonia sp. (in: high G+C Gram-positive bacteria) TaxID=84139 RepID=UPI003BB617DF
MDELSPSRLGTLIPLLAAFDAAARDEHITHAADLLGIPQSSLSRRIKTVEQLLGVQLFHQVGRRVALTASGRDLYERTNGLVRELGQAVDAVVGDADPDGGLVRFGFPLSLGPVSVAAMIADFSARAPRIRMQLVQAHGNALVEMVNDGRLDLAVMIPAPADMPATVISEQRIHLFVRRDHSLASLKQVGIEELSNEVFVANPPTYHLRKLLQAWCSEANFMPRVSFEITEFETLRAFVAHGLGIALLPEAEVPHPDLISVPLAGNRNRSIGLVSSPYPPTAPARRFRLHVANSARNYLHAGK